MSGKALSIKNDYKISFLAHEITAFIGRGSSTTEKLAATLRVIKETIGIKTLKDLEQGHIIRITEGLRHKADSGKSLSNANSYISSLNNIIRYIGRDDLDSIKASDYGLSRNISEKDWVNKENSREAAFAFKAWLNERYQKTNDLRCAALRHAVNIQSVNLRLRESLLVKLKDKDLSGNVLKITDKPARSGKWDGSKNTRARDVRLNPEQKQALIDARDFLKLNGLKNLNIGTLKQGRDFANNALKAFRKETGILFHFHGERHYKAHEAYSAAWNKKGFDGVECRARLEAPDKKTWTAAMMDKTGLSLKEFRSIDKEIRQEISRDLGHERIGITNRYLG